MSTSACAGSGDYNHSNDANAPTDLYVILSNNTLGTVNAIVCGRVRGVPRARCGTPQHRVLPPGKGAAFDLAPSAVPGALPGVLRVTGYGAHPRCLTFPRTDHTPRLEIKVTTLKSGRC